MCSSDLSTKTCGLLLKSGHRSVDTASDWLYANLVAVTRSKVNCPFPERALVVLCMILIEVVIVSLSTALIG